MKKCKICLSLICCLLILISSFIPTQITSAQSIIAEDKLIEEGYIISSLGNDIYYASKLVNSGSENTLRASIQTTSDTYSGFFYKGSTSNVLGNHEFTVTFAYDGIMVSVQDKNAQVSGVADGWKVTKSVSETTVSPTYVYGKAKFTLYSVGLFGITTEEQSVTIYIYCNEKGKTSVVRQY